MLAPPSSVDLVVRRDLVDNLLEIDLQAKSASEPQVTILTRMFLIIMMMTTKLLDKDLVDFHDDNHDGDDTNLLDKDLIVDDDENCSDDHQPS